MLSGADVATGVSADGRRLDCVAWRRRDGWRGVTRSILPAGETRVLTQLREHAQVSEMHHTEDEEDQPELSRKCLDDTGGRIGSRLQLELQADVAEIDEVEPNQQEVVHGVGQAF